MDELEDNSKNGQEGKSGGGGSKTLLIIIIAAFLLFILIAGAGFFILWKKMPNSENTQTEVAAQKEQSAQADVGPIYDLQAFVVNLADPGGNRFLRVKMSLEVKDQELVEQMDKQRIRLRDKILTILSSKSYQNVNTVQGKTELRTEISAAVDGLFEKGAVKNVYFAEFVVE